MKDLRLCRPCCPFSIYDLNVSNLIVLGRLALASQVLISTEFTERGTQAQEQQYLGMRNKLGLFLLTFHSKWPLL